MIGAKGAEEKFFISPKAPKQNFGLFFKTAQNLKEGGVKVPAPKVPAWAQRAPTPSIIRQRPAPPPHSSSVTYFMEGQKVVTSIVINLLGKQ